MTMFCLFGIVCLVSFSTVRPVHATQATADAEIRVLRGMIRIPAGIFLMGSNDGPDGRKFSWGHELPERRRAHFSAGWNELRAVGSFPQGASAYGALDMAGNGWEWISSGDRPYPYYGSDGREVLTEAQVRGTRGGGHEARPDELTTNQRGRQVSRHPRRGHYNLSFRCAR